MKSEAHNELFLSKVLNVRTFCSVFSDELQTAHLYTNLGAPIAKPAGVRGGAVAMFGWNFIQDNLDKIEYWSPIDIGSIESGLMSVAPNIVSECKLGAASLLALKERVQAAGLVEELLYHRSFDLGRCPTGAGSSVDELMQRNANHPHFWYFEIKMLPGYALNPDHVLAVFVPNTWRDIVRSSEILRSTNVHYINPKYGVEQVESAALLRPWRV